MMSKQESDLDELTQAIEGLKLERKANRAREQSEPPALQTGTCVHCGGTIRGEHAWTQRGPLIMGGKNDGFWRFEGYHCTQCGICYKFLPKVEG